MNRDSLPQSDVVAWEFLQALGAPTKPHIACIGDIMLDVEVDCTGARVSPEAPVMVLSEHENAVRLGGVGNVAANVAALGCSVSLCTLAGTDDEAGKLHGLLAAASVAFDPEEMTSDTRPTTRKKRFVSGGQQLLRVDRETCRPLDAEETQQMANMIAALPSPLSCILVSDYGKGTINAGIMDQVLTKASVEGCPVLVDPKGHEWCRYGAVSIVKPNASELAALTGLPCNNDNEVELALLKALELCSAKMILVTRAADGASLICRETDEICHFPAHKVSVADVCGAGDTNLAALGVALAADLSIRGAVRVAQLASSLAVQQRGNAVVRVAEFIRLARKREASANPDKIMHSKALAIQASEWRSEGLRVGFTNGCFDLIHAGHVRMLQHLKGHCDRVVVALNSDESVRRLKGATRPLMNQDERAAVLAAMNSVDAVVIFDEDTPERVILEVEPEILCKGGDYDPRDIVGAEFVRRRGGRVIVSDYIDGNSTSEIIERIRNSR